VIDPSRGKKFEDLLGRRKTAEEVLAARGEIRWVCSKCQAELELSDAGIHCKNCGLIGDFHTEMRRGSIVIRRIG